MSESDPITAEDIRWGGYAPTPRPDRMPARLLAAMTHDELLVYSYSMQDDLAALRVTLHETLHALAHITAADAARRDRYHAALEELRRLREDRPT